MKRFQNYVRKGNGAQSLTKKLGDEIDMKPLKKEFKIACIIAIVSSIFYSSTSLSENIQYVYGYMPSKWSSNIIPVCWENPSDANQEGREWTKEAIKESWQRHSSLQFTGWSKCNYRSRGIRIRIADDHPHTKGLGNQLDGKRNGMVLNFKFNSWSPSCHSQLYFCIKVITIHEFGHALGFSHEQNRPDAPLECQKDHQGSDGDTYLTDYDPNSVMNYCNPQWNGNGKLSTKDVKGLQKWYGQPSKPKPQTASKPSWCNSARLNETERVICHNPSLWGVEKRNREIYYQVRESISYSEKQSLKRELGRWLRTRNSRCLHSVSACLQVYQVRIADLNSRLNHKPEPRPTASEPSWCNSTRLNKTERIICNNPSLWEVEKRNREIYYQVRESISYSEKQSLKRELGRWLRTRNYRCLRSVSACLQVYQVRIADLESRLY